MTWLFKRTYINFSVPIKKTRQNFEIDMEILFRVPHAIFTIFRSLRMDRLDLLMGSLEEEERFLAWQTFSQESRWPVIYYSVLLIYFLQKLWNTLVLFVGPLITLFWTSGDVSSGFQSQGGSLTCILHHLCKMGTSDSPLVRHLLTAGRPAWQPNGLILTSNLIYL